MLNSAISLYYYIRVVVFMYLKKEEIGTVPYAGPALKIALAISVVATLALGMYPRALFEIADASARTLGVAAFTSASR